MIELGNLKEIHEMTVKGLDDLPAFFEDLPEGDIDPDRPVTGSTSTELKDVSGGDVREVQEDHSCPAFFDNLQESNTEHDAPVRSIKIGNFTDPESGETIEVTLEVDTSDMERYTSYEDRLNHTPKEDSELGSWDGERGESKFIPSEENENGNAAKEKLAVYGMDGVKYESAEPDFSDCSEAEVKIDKMTENRENYVDENGDYQFGNYTQADIKCAEDWNASSHGGKSNWTAAEVRDWRRENKYTWHECCDTSTMQLVPREIHGVFRHSGGVAECKVRDGAKFGGGFDE